MSTKTTLKRIALVAVSALGFGLFSSVSPASATGDVKFAVDATSVTVYTDSSNSASETVTASKAFALLKIRVSDDDGGRALENLETLTASVISVPTSVSAKTLSANRTDIGFVELKYASSATGNTGSNPNLYAIDTPGGRSVTSTQRNAANSGDVVLTGGDSQTNNIAIDGRIGFYNTNVSDSGTSRIYSSSGGSGVVPTVRPTYLLGVHGYSQAWDQGTYTIRLTLTDTAGFTTDTEDIKVNFVTTRGSTGAKITVTKVGDLVKSTALGATALNYARATLTNADGGRLYEMSSTAFLYAVPTLAAAVVDQDGALLTSTGLLIGDTGTTGYDTFCSSVSSCTETSTGIANRTELAFNDGVFGINTNGYTGTWDGAYENNQTSGNTSSFRVRYGATEATLAFTVLAATSATTSASSISITATGSKNHSDAANTLKMNNGNRWTVPLTTKSAVLTVRAMSNSTTPVVNYPLVFVTDWGGGFSAGEVSPREGTTFKTTVNTDSNGYASLTITNNSPVDGANVIVEVSGFTGTAAGQTILWAKSQPAVVTSNPSATFKAKTGSTNTITWTFTDTFGAPVVGEVVDLSWTGANSGTSTNRKVIPSATTDSSGAVSYTFTDAEGVEASTTVGTTTVTATSRTVSTVTNGRQITWVAAVPVIATLEGYYNDNEATSEASSYSDVVPTTVIYDTASAGTAYSINTARNLTRSLLLAGDDQDQIAFRYIAKDSAGALVTGAPVTVTVSAGLHLLSSSTGLPVTSRTIYPGTGGTVDFIVMATATGTHTITVTAGSVSKTAQVIFKNALTDARYVTLTSNASGTANALTLPSITAKVTDRWGNPVSGATLNVTHTGVGRLAGGAKTAQFTTDATGEYVIEATSTEAGTATVKVVGTASSSQLKDLAGYVGSVEMIDAVTAGVDTVSGSFTFAAGISTTQAAVEAAQDAALEAIDAANAATDAANLAAEAADAATVAAEEARDAADAATAAVEALATEVATLMAALKAQISTLANTVAKIAKKVRA